MTSRSLVPLSCLALACLFSSASIASAQTMPAAPMNSAREYTAYEKLIYKNVTQFHKSFNNREWAKNGELVADNLHVDSNGTELNGRDAFVKRIARFAVPFPDVKLDDLITIVDGNKAAVRFVITGTQQGDFQTAEGVIPASGKAIKVDGIEYFTFDSDGKLVDLVTVEDIAGLVRQLKAKN